MRRESTVKPGTERRKTFECRANLNCHWCDYFFLPTRYQVVTTSAQDKRVHKSITWISTATEIAFTTFSMNKRKPSGGDYKSHDPILEHSLNLASETSYY